MFDPITTVATIGAGIYSANRANKAAKQQANAQRDQMAYISEANEPQLEYQRQVLPLQAEQMRDIIPLETAAQKELIPLQQQLDVAALQQQLGLAPLQQSFLESYYPLQQSQMEKLLPLQTEGIEKLGASIFDRMDSTTLPPAMAQQIGQYYDQAERQLGINLADRGTLSSGARQQLGTQLGAEQAATLAQSLLGEQAKARSEALSLLGATPTYVQGTAGSGASYNTGSQYAGGGLMSMPQFNAPQAQQLDMAGLGSLMGKIPWGSLGGSPVADPSGLMAGNPYNMYGGAPSYYPGGYSGLSGL